MKITTQQRLIAGDNVSMYTPVGNLYGVVIDANDKDVRVMFERDQYYTFTQNDNRFPLLITHRNLGVLYQFKGNEIMGIPIITPDNEKYIEQLQQNLDKFEIAPVYNPYFKV